MLKLNESLKIRIERALNYLAQFDVERSDCIIIGSSIVSLISDRIPGDIDIALKPKVYLRIKKNISFSNKVIPDSGTIDIDSDFQVLLNRYGDIRLKDSQLFEDRNLTLELFGIKFARLEVEMAKKLSRNYDKDLTDVELFLSHARNDKNWNWDYVELSKSFSRKELLLRAGNRLLKNPYIALRKIQDVLVHKLGNGMSQKIHLDKLPMKTMDLGVLIQLQTKDGILQRYDIIVRKLFADAYIRTRINSISDVDNKLPFELYDIMQNKRIGRGSSNRFENLLNSIIKNGHDLGRFPIYLNRTGHVYDGSHRVASAISLKNYNIPIRMNKFLSVVPEYSKNWFIDKFSGEDIKLLEAEEKEIQLITGAAFKLILWSPAINFHKDVTDIIKKKHTLVSTEHDVLIKSLPNFIDDIYQRDGIAKWKIERKKIFFNKFVSKISVFSIIINDPEYRRNSSTGSYLSNTMAVLKASIRENLKDKIPGYFGDVVCHSSDNPQMSREINELLEKHKINEG